MGLFSKILNKLGIKKEKAETTSAVMGKEVKPVSAPKAAPARPAVPKPAAAKAPGAADRLAEKQAMIKEKHAVADSVPMVDVMSKLETMAKGTNLDWKVSIVDLLKVLGIDSSLEARKELANELDCPPDLIGGDYAEMNVWLHKKVLAEIAANGGNIPQELLD